MDINCDALESFNKALAMFGVTSDQAISAFEKIASIARSVYDPDMEIALIRSNPSLNFFQKRRLIREIRKNQKAAGY